MEARGPPPNNDLEKAKLLYNKTIELEKQLRNELKKKSPLDRSIAVLRNNIRDYFEQVLFLNYEYAISKDVEQAIWKSVFYRVIEEFRKRLRKTPQQSQQSDEQEQKRTGASFKQFLTSALNFYQRLLCKLQATFHLTLDGSVAYRLQDDNGLVKLHRSYLSCHRCFIFMGDLARYHKDIREDESDKTPPVWTRAAQYYQRALMIFPDNGNPHNQLAVLATYEDDAFSGVYRYFRSLAIRQPFVTARDNLKVLFEKNRSKLESEDGFGDQVGLFLARFVQLHGIYFHKTELEAIAPLKETLLQTFSSFLGMPNTTLEVSIILKMIAMLIFTVHNVVLPRSATEQQPQQPQQPPAQQAPPTFTIAKSPHHLAPPSSPSEDYSQLQALAISDAFDFVAVLIRAITAQRMQEKFDAALCGAYLGCVCVFAEWLRMHPEFVPRTAAITPGNMWDALAQLFNSLATLSLDASKSVPAYLSAEAELRGFLPLHNYVKTLPQTSLVLSDPNATTETPIPNQAQKITDAEAWAILSFRVRKLREFGAFACGLHPQVIFYNKDTGLYSSLHYKPNSLSLFAGARVRSPLSPPTTASMPPPPSLNHYEDNISMKDDSQDEDDDDIAEFPPTKFEFVDDDDEDDIVESAFNNKIVQDDDLEDEVILFRPDQSNFHLTSLIRSNSTSPSSSSSPSPALSPSLSAAANHHVLHDGHTNGAVQVRGAEFGIIGSRPKTPPQETAISNGSAHQSPKSATSPQLDAQSRFYTNFDFSSYYGLNHPFTLAEPAPTSPSPTSAQPQAVAPSYSLFAANNNPSSPLPQVIDMPFQSPTSTPQSVALAAQSENDEHSPTCTNKGPFAWLSPVPLNLTNGSPSLGTADISVAPASFLDSAILSTGVSLPFPFPGGEPTLKFRTKNPYINT